MPAHKRTLEERFWHGVTRGKEDDCWLWKGRKHKFGYGRVGELLSHRVSWMIHRGNLTDDMCVLHKCDARYALGDTTYRSCVNPNHLWLGNRDDNQKDMTNKNRQAVGERHGRVKLTDEQCLLILNLKGVEKATVIATRFSISWRHVYSLWKGRIRRYLTNEPIPARLKE